jgi:hypothetical protein
MEVINLNKVKNIRHGINFSRRKFQVETLPEDMQRVYKHLEGKYNEEYALLFVFTMRTAIELHRAWHMTLLTSKILQQIKDKFNMRMTWDLGVLKLKFRVEDGGHELHRKVPYDYDSEYQDIYMRIAIALIDGHIDVHEALLYQTEAKDGKHSATSGNFLRDFPGRLILYPLEAATCAVIFFGGDWKDAGIACLTGFAAGMIEYALSLIGGDVKILVDISVGLSTGLIGGLFYRHLDGNCLPAIFLGTLYWFFYGTAFVIGLLEIIAGQLETGVTRFIAVSVKTFVLSLGAALGLMLATDNTANQNWFDSQKDHCKVIDLHAVWWRIPLYFLCSASALGQYRYPIVQYWRGLAVQLAAYEVQYQTNYYLDQRHKHDNLDTAASNILGAIAGVVSACFIAFVSKRIRVFYSIRLLQTSQEKNTKLGDFAFKFMKAFSYLMRYLHLGRRSDFDKMAMGNRLRIQKREFEDPNDPRQEICLEPNDENLILETIVGAQDVNVWSVLMPALYQLVPGSIIAKLWFNSILPPSDGEGTESVFSNLMVISTSLALGVIIGFVLVQGVGFMFWSLIQKNFTGELKVAFGRMAGMYNVPITKYDDPEAVVKQTSDDPEAMVKQTSDEIETSGFVNEFSDN